MDKISQYREFVKSLITNYANSDVSNDKVEVGSIHFRAKHNYCTLETILCGLSKKADLPKVDAPVEVQLILDAERDHSQWMNVG